MILIRGRNDGIVLSTYQKPVVFITARVHPGEAPGSFLCEGLIKALTNRND